MAVAALIVSIVALVVAGGSAWYTREQARHTKRGADEAKRTADIESDRRADELEAARRAVLETMRARPRLHVQRKSNTDGSLDEGPFRYALVVANEGPAEATDVEVEIISTWDHQGTIAGFAADGRRRHRVGKVPAGLRSVVPLKDDPAVDFDDFGECDVWWRDGNADDRQQDRFPARPNWH